MICPSIPFYNVSGLVGLWNKPNTHFPVLHVDVCSVPPVHLFSRIRTLGVCACSRLSVLVSLHVCA